MTNPSPADQKHPDQNHTYENEKFHLSILIKSMYISKSEFGHKLKVTS
jgi:hypothetical protein